MFVVLDTNVILAGLRGTRPSNDLRLLLAEARAERLRLLVPQLVVDETVNKRREAATDADRKLQQARSDLADLGAAIEVPELDTVAIVEEFRSRFRELLEASKAEVPPLPGVGHAPLIQRALERRKPFASSGAGYRDALIWETVLEIARDSAARVTFITNNSKDFAEAKANDRFAADLVHDLKSIGAADRVFLVPSLSAFKDHFIPAETIAADDLDRRLNSESTIRDQFLAAISSQLERHVFDRYELSERDVDPDSLNLPYGAEDVELRGGRVRSVDRLFKVWVLSAQVSDDDVLLQLEAEIDAELELEVEFAVEDPYNRDEPWMHTRRHVNREVSALRTVLIAAEAIYRPADERVDDVYVHHVGV